MIFLSIGHTISSGSCSRTAASIAALESTTATVTSWPRSVSSIQARWLRLLCAETRNRIRRDVMTMIPPRNSSGHLHRLRRTRILPVRFSTMRGCTASTSTTSSSTTTRSRRATGRATAASPRWSVARKRASTSSSSVRAGRVPLPLRVRRGVAARARRRGRGAHAGGRGDRRSWRCRVLPVGPDGAHKVTNRAPGPARIVMFSSARRPAVAVYPDSDKLNVNPGTPRTA